MQCLIFPSLSWLPCADSDYCRYSGPPPYTVTHPEEGWTHVTLPLPPEVQGGDLAVAAAVFETHFRAVVGCLWAFMM